MTADTAALWGARLAMLTWAAVALVFVTAFVAGKAWGFSFQITETALERLALLVLAPLGFALYGWLRPPMSWLITPSHCFAQFAAFNIAALLLQYPLASLDFPAQDGLLAFMDEALGFNWKLEFTAVYHRPALFSAMISFYQGLLWQVPIVCIVLGACDRRRLQIFVTANMIALSITLILSALIPAAGAFHHYGSPLPVTWVADFLAVREGTLRTLDPDAMSGIISFPSYHTILVLLVGWAFSGSRKLLAVAIVFEAAIIVSTRIIGGHYVTDMAAGALVAVFAVWAASRLDRADVGRAAGLRTVNNS